MICIVQSLYSTVPGLQTYGQPDTRAMNHNSMLKERRFSISMSAVSDDYDDDDDDSDDDDFPRPSYPMTGRSSPTKDGR